MTHPRTPSSSHSSLDKTAKQSIKPSADGECSEKPTSDEHHHLSPMFGIHTHSLTPSHSTSPNASREKIPRGKPMVPQTRIRDGKSAQCNPDITFDDFVPPHQLGPDKPAKKIGASWDVVRAIVRLKRPLKKIASRPKSTRRSKGGYNVLDVDREGLLR